MRSRCDLRCAVLSLPQVWPPVCAARACEAGRRLRDTAARPCARYRVARGAHGARSAGGAAWSASCTPAPCLVRRRARRPSRRRACRVRARRGGWTPGTCASASRATTEAATSGQTPRTAHAPAGRDGGRRGGWRASPRRDARGLERDYAPQPGRAPSPSEEASSPRPGEQRPRCRQRPGRHQLPEWVGEKLIYLYTQSQMTCPKKCTRGSCAACWASASECAEGCRLSPRSTYHTVYVPPALYVLRYTRRAASHRSCTARMRRIARNRASFATPAPARRGLSRDA